MKKAFFIIFCLLIIMFIPVSLMAGDSSLDVGLCYGKTALTCGTITFSAPSKWEVYDGSGYRELFKVPDGTAVTIETLFQKGRFCVIIHEIKTIEEALGVVKTTSASLPAFFEKNIAVIAGPFIDKSEAESFVRALKRQYVRYAMQVISPDEGYSGIIIKPDGFTPFAYVAKGKEGFVKAHSDKGTFKLENRRYRGEVILNTYSPNGINVINRLDLEEYLYGVVPKEMPSDWPFEALKAQAVVSRTYAVKQKGSFKSFGFDIGCGTDSQVYGGYDAETETARRAVDETRGQMLYYNGSLINSYFHASSGGYTESSENVWSAPLPYLKSIPDEYSLGSPHDNWKKQVTARDVENILKNRGYSITGIRSIKPEDVTPSGRVISLKISGAQGDITLKKQEIRDVFQLKSTLFSVSTDTGITLIDGSGKKQDSSNVAEISLVTGNGIVKNPAVPDRLIVCGGYSTKAINFYPSLFEFTGSGWGHGVGMSQWGARGMALAGNNYLEILQHYYQNTEVKSF